MAIFPKIQSPCPYKSQLASVMDGDFCRMCKRTVVDLTAMSDGERLDFLSGCETEVCVSYTLPALAFAAALAVAVSPMAAAACTPDASQVIVTVGGLKRPAQAEMVHVDVDTKVPELPVVYETSAKMDAVAPVKAMTAPADGGQPAKVEPAPVRTQAGF